MRKDRDSYRILVIEDNAGDFTIVEDFLSEQILNPLIVRATTFKAGAEIMRSATRPFDVILLDLSLPDKSGEELITGVLQLADQCPVIILTGFTDINFSIKSISLGIRDYLLKDELNATTLYKSIVYAIEHKKNLSRVIASEKRYSDLFELSPQPMCLYETGTFRFLQVNKAAIAHYGYSREEFLEMILLDVVPEADRQLTIEVMEGQKRVLNETYPGKSRNCKKNGERIIVETYSTPIIINDQNVTLVIVVDVTEKNRYERNIIKAIIKTQEDERYEIGAELHDNVCQVLVTSKMTLGMLKREMPPSAEKLFDQCVGYIDLAFLEIRNLSHRLAPVFFDDSTLKEAFTRLFDTFGPEEKEKYTLYFDKEINNYPVSLEIQLNLYRIVQEQVRNIMKYANAGKIDVRISVVNNGLQLRILDDGVGFDMNTHSKGIGMANMNRRAELFSGTFKVISSPGNGCEVIVSIPFPRALHQQPGVLALEA